MENQEKKPKKALIMSEEVWEMHKLWLLQYPGAFCNTVIAQFEKYVFTMPEPPKDASTSSATVDSSETDKK